MQENFSLIPGREDPLQNGGSLQYSWLRILWQRSLACYHLGGLQRAKHDWVINTSTLRVKQSKTKRDTLHGGRSAAWRTPSGSLCFKGATTYLVREASYACSKELLHSLSSPKPAFSWLFYPLHLDSIFKFLQGKVLCILKIEMGYSL